jgi:hypothetical protein
MNTPTGTITTPLVSDLCQKGPIVHRYHQDGRLFTTRVQIIEQRRRSEDSTTKLRVNTFEANALSTLPACRMYVSGGAERPRRRRGSDDFLPQVPQLLRP